MKFIYYNPAIDMSLIEKYWQMLSRRCAHHYFLSWGWMSTWLETLPAENNVRLIVGFIDEEPMVAFFMGTAKRRKYGIFSSRIVSLNTTGMPYFDKLYLEYNSVLADPSIPLDSDLLFRSIDNMVWDEVHLPGLSLQFMDKLRNLLDRDGANFFALIDEQSSAAYVDLDAVRAAEMDYLSFLSSNRRSQIRRSIKEYEKDGVIDIVEAGTLQEAQDFFDGLVGLHQKEWTERGGAGAFSNEYLFEFHKKLIASRFSEGEIQMLRISTPKQVLGYLYNFLYNGRVYFYQSGFNYLPGNLYRPGLVSHYCSILHNARSGNSVYDFLAGDADYKSSLATGLDDMYWIRVFRRPVRYHVEKQVRSLKDRIKSVSWLSKNLKKIRNNILTDRLKKPAN